MRHKNSRINTVSSPSAAMKQRVAVAIPAYPRGRHFLISGLFAIMVVLPAALVAAYLYIVADDQYSSDVSFFVRSEAMRNPLDVLAGMGQISTGTSTDSEILYEFLTSQQIVEQILDKVALREIFSNTKDDWFYSVPKDASIEQLLKHWKWRVKVSHDKASGTLHVQTLTFTAEDSRLINQAILDESQILVDRLSRIARDDTTRYAQEELSQSAERLRVARKDFAEFRAKNKIIDPEIEIKNRGGALGELQKQLVEAMVNLQLVTSSTSSDQDPRISQAERRVVALREQLEAERSSVIGGEDEGLVKVVGEYETLFLEREFAEKAYLAASAALDSARAEADRRSKYLAVHIGPTQAKTSLYPQRGLTLIIVTAGLFLVWVITVMSVYALRDRR